MSLPTFIQQQEAEEARVVSSSPARAAGARKVVANTGATTVTRIGESFPSIWNAQPNP